MVGTVAGTALITGASSGIGAAFARQLASRGHELVIVARRMDRMEALAAELRQRHGVSVKSVVADLSRPADVERVEHRFAGIQSLALLINNAGFGTVGYFRETYDTPEYRRVGMKPKVESTIPKAMWMTADELVAASLESLEHGRLLCAPGFVNRLAVLLGRMGLAPLVSRVLAAGFRRELRGSPSGSAWDASGER